MGFGRKVILFGKKIRHLPEVVFVRGVRLHKSSKNLNTSPENRAYDINKDMKGVINVNHRY